MHVNHICQQTSYDKQTGQDNTTQCFATVVLQECVNVTELNLQLQQKQGPSKLFEIETA